jgi:Protein of unknown function (DUF3551)
MVHCKQNNVDIKSFPAPLLLVTSQTRSASVESREVEALSNLRRRRPRGPSLGRISRRKAAAVSLENKNFASSMYVSGAGPRPCSFFFGPDHRSASPRMACTGVFAITSDARPLQYVWRTILFAQETSMRTIILATAALAAASLTTSIPAHADGPWCARDVLGGTNCGFYSYAQCRADIVGIGGSCVPNLNYTGAVQGYGRDSRRRPHQY